MKKNSGRGHKPGYDLDLFPDPWPDTQLTLTSNDDHLVRLEKERTKTSFSDESIITVIENDSARIEGPSYFKLDSNILKLSLHWMAYGYQIIDFEWLG